MINRYMRSGMKKIWSEESRYEAWLEVEILACDAWVELGVIPRQEAMLIRQNARVDISRIHEIEEETRHDVVAFTRAVSETLGPESKWIHYGLTSTDVVDTALSYVIKSANEYIFQGIDRLIAELKKKALEHKHTVMMGRTHGVHAEPTTWGLKMLLWYEEMKRNQERLQAVCERVHIGKISGAVGTYANVDPFVERYVCEKLGLAVSPISTQILQRDRHAEYMAVLALIGTSIEKFATEIRGLQKSEIREVEEGFAKGQKGSSAMPHKKNPIGCENVSGLARLLRGYMVASYENVALWHERDISHSSVERVVLPDATALIDYMLDRFSTIIHHLKVYPENMERNMGRTFGLIYSQKVLLQLIQKGLLREEAYDIVQLIAMRSWEEQQCFETLVGEHDVISKVLTKKEIEACFDYNDHLSHVDMIFDRVLGDRSS